MSTSDSTPDTTSPPVPATRARFVLLGFLASLVFVLYLDRVCMGQAAVAIQEELSISNTEMGFVIGAFTIAYGLFEVPTGRWGDRYGSRGVLTRIVLWWSVFTALTGCVQQFCWFPEYGFKIPWLNLSVTGLFNSFLLLIVIRFLFGAGEAGALPNNARVVAQWFPLDERWIAQAAVLTCMQLGGACSPPVAQWLIKTIGWRLSFVAFGSLGVVWASLFYWWFRDDPAEHPAVNEAERLRIGRGTAGDHDRSLHPPIPWGLVLSSPNVWLLGLIMSCSASASYMYMFWFPSYLQVARGVSGDEAGWLSGMVLAGGAIGALAGSVLGERIVQGLGGGDWTRRLYGFTFLAIAGVCLDMSVWCDSPFVASLCAAVACAVAFASIPNWWSTTVAISGRHLAALYGLMNSMGVPGALGSPLFLGIYTDSRKLAGYVGRDQWDPAFHVYAGVLVAGACCWLFVNSSKSVVEPEPAACET